MQNINTHEAERAAMAARYRRELRRGVVPSVYIPRPDTSHSRNDASSTAKAVDLCSGCGKPRDRNPLPEQSIFVSMKCYHSFCSRCCLKMAGKTTCMRRGCKEPIPACTQAILVSQKRHWALTQALSYCESDEQVPLHWHNRLKGVEPSYCKAESFLQNAVDTSSSLSSDAHAAFINIDSLRPHLVGFANLLISMRHTEAHLRDLDGDPTDLLRQRKWRYTVMAIDHYLEYQAKQRKRCTVAMLREYMQPGANQVLDEIWGLIDNFPAWIISPNDDEDVKLLFDFVIELCREEAEKRSLRSRSFAVVSKLRAKSTR